MNSGPILGSDLRSSRGLRLCCSLYQPIPVHFCSGNGLHLKVFPKEVAVSNVCRKQTPQCNSLGQSSRGTSGLSVEYTIAIQKTLIMLLKIYFCSSILSLSDS